MDSSLSEWDAALEVAIVLIWVSAIFLLSLTSMVGRKTHQYPRIKEL